MTYYIHLFCLNNRKRLLLTFFEDFAAASFLYPVLLQTIVGYLFQLLEKSADAG